MQKTFAILLLAFAATVAFAQTNKPEDYKVNQSGAQKITNGPVIDHRQRPLGVDRLEHQRSRRHVTSHPVPIKTISINAQKKLGEAPTIAGDQESSAFDDLLLPGAV